MAQDSPPLQSQNMSPMQRGIIAILAGIMGVGAILFVAHAPLHSWDLRNNLWGPAHLLLRGQSPYRIDLLFDNSNAVWLPMAIGAFFPLGWFSEGQAANLWFLANLSMLIGIVWLSAGARRPAPLLLGICVIAATLFPATISHLILGQFTIATVLLLLIASRLVGKRPPILAGLLTALALTKPQLAVLALPGMMMGYWRAGRLKAVAAFLGLTGLWAILLTIPLWMAFPHWFTDFLSALEHNPIWAQPASLDVFRATFGNVGTFMWGILALTALGLSLWLWNTHLPPIAMMWSLAFTTLVSPYVWSWDFVMLIPLAVHTIFHTASRLGRGLLALGYIAISGSMIYIRLNTDNSDYRYWWVPWAALAVIAGVQLLSRKPAPAE